MNYLLSYVVYPGIRDKRIDADVFIANSNIQFLKVITEVVCTYYGLSVDEIKVNNQKRHIAMPRQMVFYICHFLRKRYKVRGVSYAWMGECFGKGHCTVIYSIKKISGEILLYEDIRRDLSVILKKCDDKLWRFTKTEGVNKF